MTLDRILNAIHTAPADDVPAMFAAIAERAAQVGAAASFERFTLTADQAWIDEFAVHAADWLEELNA